MGVHDDYREGLLARFAGRPVLSHEALHRRFWPDLDRRETAELFALVEAEYDVPVGLLRADDPVVRLTRRVPHRRWWRAPVHDVIAGDREFGLVDELYRRRRRRGLADVRIDTVDFLVRAWCERPGSVPRRSPQPPSP